MTTDQDFQETFELISVGPAATGWRAVHSGAGGPAQVPLVAWGVFRRTRREPTGVGSEDLGTVMAGIVGNSSPGGPVREFQCAAGLDGFEGYLPPA